MAEFAVGVVMIVEAEDAPSARASVFQVVSDAGREYGVTLFSESDPIEVNGDG